jgi:REP element-mobilizing transposase RayT
MPRPARILDAGLLHHVMSRGTGKMKIFLDDGDRHNFMFLLAEVAAEYGLDCYDYCLMDNHFHLSIRNQRTNLSAAMQKLKGEYASSWNAKYGRVGHTFEGPFKDQIVQDERYFRHLTRYIARNPVRAGLVGAPQDWRWSSYRVHAGFELRPDFLASDYVLDRFGKGDRGAARAAYIAHVTSASDQEREAALFRARRRLVGDAAFRAAIRGTARPERSNRALVSPAVEVRLADLPV